MHVCTHGGVPPNTPPWARERVWSHSPPHSVHVAPALQCGVPRPPVPSHHPLLLWDPHAGSQPGSDKSPTPPPRLQLTLSPMGHAQGQGAWGSLVPCLVHGFALWAVVSRGAGGPAVGFGPPHFGTLHFPRGAGVGAAGLAVSEPSLPPASSSSPSSWSLRTRSVRYGGMDRGSVKW